jgi:hypothetical protein
MNEPANPRAGQQGIWVYAVAETARAGVPTDVPGVAGRPVGAVAAAGLTAVVSEVDLAEFGEQALRRNLEDLAWLEATAWAHHRVIDAFARSSPVVPMRLATVFGSTGRVAAMLEERACDLSAALALVDARTEWGVKVYAVERQSPPAGPAGGAPSRPGAAYLLRRKAELSASEDAKRAAAASAADLHAALSGLAAAALVRPPQGPQLTGGAGQMIFNGAYLVANEHSADWSAAVKDLADRHPAIRVELTGPWPPYSFAAIEDSPRAADQPGCPAGHG